MTGRLTYEATDPNFHLIHVSSPRVCVQCFLYLLLLSTPFPFSTALLEHRTEMKKYVTSEELACVPIRAVQSLSNNYSVQINDLEGKRAAATK